MADHAGTVCDPGLHPQILDLVSVFDLQPGKGTARLGDHFPIALGTQQILSTTAVFLVR
jgi:hypothetical protein